MCESNVKIVFFGKKKQNPKKIRPHALKDGGSYCRKNSDIGIFSRLALWVKYEYMGRFSWNLYFQTEHSFTDCSALYRIPLQLLKGGVHILPRNKIPICTFFSLFFCLRMSTQKWPFLENEGPHFPMLYTEQKTKGWRFPRRYWELHFYKISNYNNIEHWISHDSILCPRISTFK